MAANPDAGALTADEVALLQEVATGTKLATIARQQGMSQRTLRRGLRGICVKLRVGRPIEAVVWAARRGVI